MKMHLSLLMGIFLSGSTHTSQEHTCTKIYKRDESQPALITVCAGTASLIGSCIGSAVMHYLLQPREGRQPIMSPRN
jgi:hypothetical protein